MLRQQSSRFLFNVFHIPCTERTLLHEGRHFFMHPRDTFGLMLELTDDRLAGDPRNGLSPTGGGDGLVQVLGVAHVTGVVVDLEPVAALLHQIFGAEPRAVESDGPETIADFASDSMLSASSGVPAILSTLVGAVLGARVIGNGDGRYIAGAISGSISI